MFEQSMPEAEARLKRQITVMSESLATKSVETDQTLFEMKESLYMNELATLLKEAGIGRFSCRHAGGGLILVVFRTHKRSLYSKISKGIKLTPDGFVGDFLPLAIKTCCATNYNSLIIG